MGSRILVVLTLIVFCGTSSVYAEHGSSSARPSSSELSPHLKRIKENTPILMKDRCLGCHSGDGVFEGNGALKAEKEEQALQRILSSDPEERMPPKEEEPLDPSEIESIKIWVKLQQLEREASKSTTSSKKAKLHETPTTDLEARAILNRACSNCHGNLATWALHTVPLRVPHRRFIDDDGSIMGSEIGKEGVRPKLELRLIEEDLRRDSMPPRGEPFASLNSLLSWRHDPLPDRDKKKLLTWLEQLRSKDKPEEHALLQRKKGGPYFSTKPGAERHCASRGMHLPSKYQMADLEKYLTDELQGTTACVWTSGFFDDDRDRSEMAREAGVSSTVVEQGANLVWVMKEGKGKRSFRKSSELCSVLCVR